MSQSLLPGDGSRTAWRNTNDLGALTVLVAAWFVYAGPMLSPATNLYATDTFCHDLPLRLYAARAIRAAEFPLWTPHVNCGYPLFADGQAGVLYPFFAMYVAWPTPEAHDWFMALHFLLLGGFTYRFLRGQQLAPTASLLGAVTFMASSYHQATHVVPGLLAAVVWLPLALHLIYRGVNGHGRALWWCAIVNAVALLAGAVHVALISYSLQALWLLYLCWPRVVRHGIPQATIAFVLPLMLCAVQIWPTRQLLGASNRATGLFAPSLDWKTFSDFLVPWRFLITFFWPSAYGTPSAWPGSFETNFPLWEESLVVFHGFGAIVLLPLGICIGKPRSKVWFWLAMLVLATFVSMSSTGRWLMMYVPLHNLFRAPARYMVVASLSASVLVAYGADVLLASVRRAWQVRRPRLVKAVYAGTVLLCVAGAVYHHFGSYLTKADFYAIHSPELVSAAHRGQHFRLLPLARAVFRYWSLDDAQLRRTAASLPVSYNLLFDVPVATILDQGNAVSPRHLTELIQSRHPNALKLAAITHLSCPISIDEIASDVETMFLPEPIPPKDQVEVLSTAPAFVYRYRSPLPRAHMVYSTRIVADDAARLAVLLSPDFDPSREAIVEQELPRFVEPTERPQVTLSQAKLNLLKVEVETAGSGLLVVSDCYFPHLLATVDGNAQNMVRVNHAFCGIPLTAGRHVVCLQYSARPVYQGLAVTLAAAAVVCIGLWRSR
ncbi:MAG: YfhO family protein [Pirellulales bacterium]|nr:YfhO family protein [Pirellulales bacterium]